MSYAQTGTEQCSPAQPIGCESCCVVLISEYNAAAEKEQCFGLFAVHYTRLGIDLLLKQYPFHRVREARLQYQSYDCDP